MAFYLARKCIRTLPGRVIKLVPMPTPSLIEGVDSRGKAGTACANTGAASALLVTSDMLCELGFHEAVINSLTQAGIRCQVFSGVNTEPTVRIVDAGRQAARECGAQCVIALGGGSVLDASKMIAAGIKTPRKKTAALLRKFLWVKGKTSPIVAIPSTAGTGAEMTVGAVITDERKGKKSSTVVIGLNIATVILDPQLTQDAPRALTAACGIDALSHGLEGCFADIRVSDEDQRKSMECVRLVLENLPKVLADPHDMTARAHMCRAANYGGNAINKQLAGYVHAFAHAIGAKYHLPHGNAIALVMLPVIRAQQDILEDDLAELARYCGLVSEDGTQDATKHNGSQGAAMQGDSQAAAMQGDSQDATMQASSRNAAPQTNSRSATAQTGSQAAAAQAMLTALEDLIALCDFPNQAGLITRADYAELTRMINADSINYSPPLTFSDTLIGAVLSELS